MKKRTIQLLFSISLVILGIGSNAQNSTIEKNKAIAKEFIEAWNNHDSLKVASLFPATFLYRDMALNMKITSNPKLISYVRGTVKGAPDLTFQATSLMASDTMAMVEWTWKGTFSGGWGARYPASNKPFTIQGISVMVIKNGQIIRNYDYYDGDFFRKKIESTPTNK